MEYLVISAIAPHNTHILHELTQLATKSDCNIEQTRMSIMGSEMAILILVSGNWNTIAKMEGTLVNREKELGITAVIKRTKMYIPPQDLLPYVIHMVALDQAGIVHEIIQFIIQQNIQIYELQSNTYTASMSGAFMFSLTMRIGIPIDTSIADFREQLALLCDEMNLDGMLEPEKH